MNQQYPYGRKPKKDSDALWVLAIVLGFIFAWPIGLVLLFLKKYYDKNLKNQVEEQKKSADGGYSYRYENGQPVNTYNTSAKTAEQTVRSRTSYAAPAKAKKKKPKQRKKKTTWGYNLAAAISAFVGTTMLIDTISSIVSWGFEGYYLEGLLFAAVFLIAALVVFWLGCGVRNRERRYARYSNIIGSRTEVPLDFIASVMRKNRGAVARDLQALIDRDYFGERAYIDYGRMLLILDADRVELDPPVKEEEPAAPAEELPDSEREKILKEIRHMDVIIDDPVVSEKIVRIEILTDKILSLVESKPEKKPQIRSFMNYYLPTTLKLLKSYSELEAQGVAGETITKAKDSIAEIMDNLIAAFETQLDQLFSSEAMDISSDIEVLESMMRRDGFTNDGLNLKMTRD